MKNKQVLLFASLSLAFTLWYYRFIFSPSSEMLGIATTDGFQSLSIVVKNLGIIQTGHIPFGTFWLFDFYGGSTATFYSVSNIPNIPHSSFLILNLFFNDPIFWLKIFMFTMLLISQFCAYKYTKFHFQNAAIAWIVSIGYSFCTFYLTHINDGHAGFIAAAAFMPGVFLLFEKMSIIPKRKNMIYASAALAALFLCDLQITIFAMGYILLRMTYQIAINLDGVKRKLIVKRFFECVALFSLSAAPFLISFSFLQNTGALVVPAIPTQYSTVASQFFLREVGSTNDASSTLITSLYIGIILFAFSIVPMLFLKHKFNRRNYLFHLLTILFFFLIAIGTPLSNLATTFFIRVPSRAQILVVFSMCICAGYGLLCLSDALTLKSQKINWIRKNKLLHTLLVVGLAVIIFVDLTVEASPVTSTVPKLTGGDHFIEIQQGDFRIIEFPIVWGYTNYESALINHEIIGESVIALRCYPPSSELYSDLVNNFNGIGQFLNVDPANFTLLATLNGAKYILIEKNDAKAMDYINFFNNATTEGFFAIAYNDHDSIVYQNLYFAGVAFAVKDEGQIPTLENLTLKDFSKMTLDAQIEVTQGFNNIKVSGNVSASAYVVLSQSYSKYWVNSDNGDSAFVKFLNVTAFHVNQGSFKVNAVFSAADQTWNLYIVFFGSLVFVGTVLYASLKDKKNLLKITLCLLLVFGLVTTFLAFLGTSSAPQFMRNLAVFKGVFNNVILLFGCAMALGSLVLLNWNKITTFASSIFNLAKKFRRDISGDEADVKGKRLAAGILIVALVLTVIAFFFASSTYIVFKLQQTVTNGIYTENYVAAGTQFSLGLSGTELLLAGLIFFMVVAYLVAFRLLSELKRGIITSSLVVAVGSSISTLAILYAVFEGGLFLSLAIFDSGMFWFILLTCSSSIMAVLLVLRGPIVLTSLSAFRRMLSSIGSVANLLLKVLLVSSLLFIVLANLPLGFPDATSWLDGNIAGILLVEVFLYIVVRISAWPGKLDSHRESKGIEVFENEKVIQENRVGHLHFGVVGGLVGILAAGLLMRTITLCSQDVYTPAFILCGAFSGLGFGALTRGKSRTRGIIGCVFGFIAIMFGLIMAFNVPIVIGYTTNYSTGMLLPIYKWHENAFIQFAGTQLLDMNGLFFCFFGLLAAYLGGSKLSLKTLGKRRFIRSDEQNPKD